MWSISPQTAAFVHLQKTYQERTETQANQQLNKTEINEPPVCLFK